MSKAPDVTCCTYLREELDMLESLGLLGCLAES